MTRNPFPQIMTALGCFFLVNSAALYAVLHRSTAAEQALTPGEKNLGLAALAMPYALPFFASGAAGVLCVFLGISIATFRRFRGKRSG
jgi:hypothetical protein